MKLGIIGSSGFIGRHLTSYFQSAVPIGRSDVDLLDADAVKDYFGHNQFDVIIHCAVIGGGRMCDENPNILDSNLRMFFNVREATPARIVYLSSGAALRGAPPRDPYGFSKYVIEKCPGVQIVRIWGCFGPDEPETRFFATAKRDGHVNIHKDCRFDFCHVDDLCRIVEHAITHTGPPINAIYPGPKHLLSEMAEMTGVPYTILGTGEDYVGQSNIECVELSTLEQQIKRTMNNKL